MPQRSNDYQRLILAINEQLADSDAIIEESKLLYDHESEKNREIDIYIETRSGPYSTSIGIECTDKSRPLDTSKVSELIHKHRVCGINKTIIVSRLGLSKSALKVAQKNGVEAITFGQAKDITWPSYLRIAQDIRLNLYSVRVDDLDFTLRSQSNATKSNSSKSLYFVQEDGSPLSVYEYVGKLLEASKQAPFKRHS